MPSLPPAKSDFTVGRIVLRRRAFGWWSGKASVRNVRYAGLFRGRGFAEGWAAKIQSDTGTRTWAGMNSRNVETMSLCDEEAVR